MDKVNISPSQVDYAEAREIMRMASCALRLSFNMIANIPIGNHSFFSKKSDFDDFIEHCDSVQRVLYNAYDSYNKCIEQLKTDLPKNAANPAEKSS